MNSSFCSLPKEQAVKNSVLERIGGVVVAVLVWHALAHVIYRNIMLRAASQAGIPKTSWSYYDWSVGSLLSSHLLAFVALVWVMVVVKGIAKLVT